MFDFTQILTNAEIIKAKLKKPEPIVKTGGSLYNGKPFLLRDIKTGDCKRFENALELKKELGYKTTRASNGPNLNQLMKYDRFKNKYEWFAWEWELLACPTLKLI